MFDTLSLERRTSKLAERRLGIKEVGLAGTAVHEEMNDGSDFGRKWAGLRFKSHGPWLSTLEARARLPPEEVAAEQLGQGRSAQAIAKS